MGGPGERKERKSKREKKGKERKQSLSNHSKWGGRGGGLFTALPLLRGGGEGKRVEHALYAAPLKK